MIAPLAGLARLAALLVASAMLAACAAAPRAETPAPPSATLTAPLVTSSGLVIGTLSYQYAEAADLAPPSAWVIHFERLDTPAAQDYALVVDVDQTRNQGVFSGTLPAGVYAFREAASAHRRYGSGALRMPFEVQPGEVRDAGHYAVNPLQ